MYRIFKNYSMELQLDSSHNQLNHSHNHLSAFIFIIFLALTAAELDLALSTSKRLFSVAVSLCKQPQRLGKHLGTLKTSSLFE